MKKYLVLVIVLTAVAAGLAGPQTNTITQKQWTPEPANPNFWASQPGAKTAEWHIPPVPGTPLAEPTALVETRAVGYPYYSEYYGYPRMYRYPYSSYYPHYWSAGISIGVGSSYPRHRYGGYYLGHRHYHHPRYHRHHR